MPQEPGADPTRPKYWRRLMRDWEWPRPKTRGGRIVGFVAIPVFLIAAFVVAGALPFVSSRFEHLEAAVCIPPRDIPWRLETIGAWCAVAKRRGDASAYTRVADMEFRQARVLRSLELYRTGAALGDPMAHVQMGMILVQGGFGQVQVDRAQGIVAFENAFKLGHFGAMQMLKDVYSGQLGRGPREPRKAAMWAHAYALVKSDDMEDARVYSRKLGLSEGEIDGAREDMRRWLELNKIRPR